LEVEFEGKIAAQKELERLKNEEMKKLMPEIEELTKDKTVLPPSR
jgi:hypothetical protein